MFTTEDIVKLRKRTNAGMMDCKKALTECNGDLDKASEWLREKGIAAAAKKADRIAADGLVDILKDGDVTAMVEVNTETDFVAKNATFKEFVKGLLRTVVACRPASLEELNACKFDGTDFTVEETVKDKIFTIGEKISVRRFAVVEGTTSTYIHGTGVTGVIVKFVADDVCVNNAGFEEFAKNIALQIAAYPTAYLNRDSVPASVIESEKAIIMTQMQNDPKMAGKPEKVLQGIIMGKLGKFYEENCLLDKEYVKDDSMKVKQYVAASAKEFGGKIEVVGFERFEKGEGIEKRADNLDEEVAKMLGK